MKAYWYTNFFKQIFANSPAYGGWKASGGDTFRIALYSPAYIPNQDTHVSYNDIIQVSGQGYTAGGQVLTGKTISAASGALVLGANPVSWAGCVFPVRGAAIYDDTNTGSLNKQLVRWIDFEQIIQLAGDTITLTFDGAGTVTITPPADTTPPQLVDASVDGPNLTLSYNEQLDTTSVPATSAYTVLVNSVPATISSVAVSSLQVNLTLSAAVVSADVVSVSYTVPGTNPLLDLAFNPAASFSGVSVFNATTPPPPPPPPPDVTPPVVAITSPANLATISGTITVTATATDLNGVVSTVLFVDGTAFSTDTSSPYSFGLDTTSLSNGAHTLQAKAKDPAGNEGVSAVVNVTVSNVVPPPPDTTPPSVTITSPLAGAFLAGTFTIAVAATDNVGVVSATLFVDGVSQGVDPSQPYSFSLNTALFTDGTHSLVATAIDAASNVGTSSTVFVVFDNTVPVLSTATINGASLVLTYPENLNTASVPLTSAFTVKTDGNTRSLNSVSVSGLQVLITLAVPVLAANVVTISYTAPTGSGATPIEDRAGNNAANLVDRAVTNQTPGDTTPPTISSLTVNAASLVIQYSENLDTNSVPATAAFAVTVNGSARSVNSVAISGRNVTLTLSTAVLSTETVGCSYTQPLTGKIRDIGQNNAASFFNLPVQNITAPPPPPPEPVAPVLSSVSSPDSGSITWNNTNVADETGYEYESATILNEPFTTWTLRGSRPADTTTFTWSGATASTTYYMRVSSVGPSGARYPSNILNVTTAAPPPPPPPPEPVAPTLTSVSAPTSTSITWNHTNVTDELGYEYQTSPASSGPWTVRGSSAANSTTFTWLSATQQTLYFMRVASFGAAGTRYPSNVLSVTTPTTPIVDAASFVSQSVPSLTMAPSSSQNVSVTMRNDGTGSWSSAAGYHLYSQNPAGTTRWGITQVPVSGSVIPNGNATFNFSIAAPTSGNATVSWDANTEPDLAGYRLYYGTAPGVYGTPIDVGNVTSYLVTGLTAGVVYYFAVTAYDTSGNESAKSTEVTLSTLIFPFQWRMRHTTTEFGAQSPSVMISVVAPSQQGAVFISTTGSDTSGNGTQTNPYRTLAKAFQFVQPSGSVEIRGGTYLEGVVNNCPPGTSWTNMVTVRAFQNEPVILRPPSSNNFVVWLQTAAKRYIQFRDLVLDAVNVISNAVKLDSPVSGTDTANHIRFYNCEVMNSRFIAILTNYGGDFNEFQKLRIHNCGKTLDSDGLYGYAFYIKGSNSIVEDCEIYDQGSSGIQIFSTTASTQPPNNNTIRRCYVHNNCVLSAAQSRGAGISVASGTGNAVYNNLVISNFRGINSAFTFTNKFLNNTVVSNPDIGIYLEGGGSHSCRNNIAYLNGTNFLNSSSGGTVTPNLIGTSPPFVNSASDWHLAAGTNVAVGTGVTLTEFNNDYDLNPRPFGSAWDQGAYERQS